MNPILNKMGANANEQKKLLMECVSMLVQTDILLDGKFFCGTSSGNSGIGTDGCFTGYEFFQFIYRAYKALYELEKASQMR